MGSDMAPFDPTDYGLPTSPRTPPRQIRRSGDGRRAAQAALEQRAREQLEQQAESRERMRMGFEDHRTIELEAKYERYLESLID